jgi:hypothetical protein|tara:strand:+ start:93 stop:632 length:540 start_codon:yes stop_codon:yes gene_type:complete
MIKLKDLLNEVRLAPYQIFSPGTGGKDMKNFKFNPNKVPTGRLKVGNFMACSNKPNGAFWTSSYKPKLKGSEWTDWKKRNQPSWRTGMGAVFEIVGSPKIAKVSNQKDYDKLVKKYSNDTSDMGCSGGEYYLDWYKLSQDYDAFQITKYSFIPGIHEWDVESTAWFNMKKLKFVGTTKV